MALEETFELSVEPPDPTAPAPGPPPRTMPELPPEDVARRLRAKVDVTGGALAIHFPFPAGAATAADFVLAALVSVLPGFSLPWPAVRGLPVAVAVVSGGLSAFMLLVLLTSLRTLEVRAGTVRMTRGLFGLGFHRSLPARDVAEVVENPFLLPDASPRFYGVALRTEDGTPHGAAPRMRDAASARALAQLLASVLPRACPPARRGVARIGPSRSGRGSPASRDRALDTLERRGHYFAGELRIRRDARVRRLRLASSRRPPPQVPVLALTASRARRAGTARPEPSHTGPRRLLPYGGASRGGGDGVTTPPGPASQ